MVPLRMAGAGRIQNGLGMKSHLPIDNPRVWLGSDAGRAWRASDTALTFVIPNSVGYPLSIVSEPTLTSSCARSIRGARADTASLPFSSTLDKIDRKSAELG